MKQSEETKTFPSYFFLFLSLLLVPKTTLTYKIVFICQFMKHLSYNRLDIHETTFRNAKRYLPIILIINTYILPTASKDF